MSAGRGAIRRATAALLGLAFAFGLYGGAHAPHRGPGHPGHGPRHADPRPGGGSHAPPERPAPGAPVPLDCPCIGTCHGAAATPLASAPVHPVGPRDALLAIDPDPAPPSSRRSAPPYLLPFANGPPPG